MPWKIPLADLDFGPEESAAVQKVLESRWLTMGEITQEFEHTFASYNQVKHAFAVANGTAALHLACAAIGLGRGDEVITPALTFVATANAIRYTGAVPVFADIVSPTDLTIDPQAIEALINDRTKAIMLMHYGGYACDMAAILALARKYHLSVIEDAAHALGTRYNGQCVGQRGTSIFSFHPIKNITTGEGGMLLTDDASLAEAARSKRNLCFTAERRFVHEELGYNMRMSNLQAAVGVAQLERLDEHLARKHAIGARYRELLTDVPGLALPAEATAHARNGYWVFGVLLGDEVEADAADVMRLLAERGIGTRPFFYPMHLQPVFRRAGLFEGVSCPVAERLATRGFYLPSGLALTDAQITKQIEYCLDKGWAVGIEYTDDPHPRNTFWEMYGNPMFDLKDPAGILMEINACRKTFPDQYVRVTAFDSTHGTESVVLSFIVNRPKQEPGFRLIRTEEPGRSIRYSIESYAVAQRPEGARY